MKVKPLYNHKAFTNFRQIIDENAEITPDRTAFQYQKEGQISSITYTQFRKDIYSLCTLLLGKGIRGKNIALVGENCYEWILSYFAIVLSGNIVVPIDKELPDDTIIELINRCGAAALIHSESYSDVAAAAHRERSINTTLSMKDIPKLIEDQEQILSIHITDEDDVCSIIFTSGTTGTPKGVMLTQKNLVVDAVHSSNVVRVTDTSLLTLPLHHTFAFTAGVLGMLIKAVPIYINKNLRTFTADIKIARPQNMILVPLYVETFYKNIWDAAKEQGKTKSLRKLIAVSNAMRKIGIDLRRKLFQVVLQQFGGRLELIVCGGAPLKQDCIDCLDAIGVQVLNGYGITECAPVVSGNWCNYTKKNSVGLPLQCCEIKIDDGEICVKGENMMVGYYQDEAATKEAIVDNWFHTGDLGYLDKDGVLFITGRKKNLIILSNGKNVSPEELEEKLLELPDVLEVIVYALDGVITAEIYTEHPDGIWERIMELNRSLPSYKHIQRVKFRDREFEKTTSKKIKRAIIIN